MNCLQNPSRSVAQAAILLLLPRAWWLRQPCHSAYNQQLSTQRAYA